MKVYFIQTTFRKQKIQRKINQQYGMMRLCQELDRLKMFYLSRAKKHSTNALTFSRLDDLNFTDDVPRILKMEEILKKYRKTHRSLYRLVFLEIL